MRKEEIIEGRTTELALTDTQATELSALGRRLASSLLWWGIIDEENSERARTVISCRRENAGTWLIKVDNAVGLIVVRELQILVRPKIPPAHLLFLFAASGAFPRLDEQRGELASSDSLWDLIATWFVRSSEQLLRRDLIRDYHEIEDDLQLVRGRIDAFITASHFYAGRVAVRCEFDEFEVNTPLNRMIKAAARVVTGSRVLDVGLRRRTARILMRLDDVGEFEWNDLSAQVDRRTAHYADAVVLARHILRSVGRTLEHGGAASWTFLIRTPEMVEAGLRKALQQLIGDRWRIDKKGRQVAGASMTFNPDLVFENGLATGDVKYKLVDPDWTHMRADLYQAIAFATLFRTSYGAMIRFRTDDRPAAPSVGIGSLRVTPFEWDASADINPEEAAAVLAAEINLWLETISLPGMAEGSHDGGINF